MEEKKTETLTDQSFNRLVLTALISILVCITLLCSSTFAWYSTTLHGKDNSIKTAGECLLQISVKNGGQKVAFVDGSLTLERGVTYTVTLTMPKDSPSGYCVITTADGKYRSEALVRHENDTPTEISFALSIAQQQNELGEDITPQSLTVGIETRWGIYSGNVNVTHGGTLEIE